MLDNEIKLKNETLFNEKLNVDIINYYIKLLKESNDNIKKIISYSNDLVNYIKEYINNSYKFEFEKGINYFTKILEKYKKKEFINYENLLNKQKQKLKDFYELTSNIYLNNNFQNIKELNEKLKFNLNSLADPEFMPPKINDIGSSSINLTFSKFYSQINVKEEIEKEKDNNNNNKCLFCKQNKSICFCDTCYTEFCSECLDSIIELEKKNSKHMHKHSIIYIDEIKLESEETKILFLKSINFLIKIILKNSSDILNSEKILLRDNNDYNFSKKYYIKRVIKYPSLKNFQSFDLKSIIPFLKEINSILKDELNIIDIKNNLNNSFHISELNKTLLFSIKKIFIDEKINIYKETLNILESNFFSYDDVTQTIIFNDSYNEYEENKNKFYYSINLTPIRNYSFLDISNIKDTLTNKIISNLSIDKDNILVSFYGKNNFIDNFIRTKEFIELSLQMIKNTYPNLEQLYELKMINDLLSEQYEMRKYIDYLGNFIIPNKSSNLKRGTEKYYPPYGWFGIGLKVKGKYKGDKKDKDDNWLNDISESSKWAIAYHGVGRMSTDDEIKKILLNIMEEGLKPGQSQIKCHSMDKRHPGKKIGTGVYLTQNISIAEEYSGIIQFNNKQYKIVLMAKVLIEKIREPEDYNYWILSNNNIRVYRILLKEKI